MNKISKEQLTIYYSLFGEDRVNYGLELISPFLPEPLIINKIDVFSGRLLTDLDKLFHLISIVEGYSTLYNSENKVLKVL